MQLASLVTTFPAPPPFRRVPLTNRRLLLGALLALSATVAHAQSTTAPADRDAEIAALKKELELLKGKLPDQSHAMKDVAYHFGNLWFAAQKQNWPLAEFYLAETRSHLRWAVRIIPVRKTPQGQELVLADVLEPLDKTVFKDLQDLVKGKDAAGFSAKYEQALNACYSCHVMAGKPFLRLQIPQQPEVSIIRFDPEP